eukprot:4250628-Lingulodinium_polyedra.AAC.1
MRLSESALASSSSASTPSPSDRADRRPPGPETGRRSAARWEGASGTGEPGVPEREFGLTLGDLPDATEAEELAKGRHV